MFKRGAPHDTRLLSFSVVRHRSRHRCPGAHSFSWIRNTSPTTWPPRRRPSHHHHHPEAARRVLPWCCRRHLGRGEGGAGWRGVAAPPCLGGRPGMIQASRRNFRRHCSARRPHRCGSGCSGSTRCGSWRSARGGNGCDGALAGRGQVPPTRPEVVAPAAPAGPAPSLSLPVIPACWSRGTLRAWWVGAGAARRAGQR